MQLNRAPYGSMCDGAIGLIDLPTVHCPLVVDREWKSESLRYSRDEVCHLCYHNRHHFINEHVNMGKEWIHLRAGTLVHLLWLWVYVHYGLLHTSPFLHWHPNWCWWFQINALCSLYIIINYNNKHQKLILIRTTFNAKLVFALYVYSGFDYPAV